MNIAAVVVNWNKKADVLDLLNDLAGVKSPAFDVFVVDNASTDGSPEAIRVRFPHVQLIINKENLGGTGGFNTGVDHILKLGGYDYIWLLDNDAKIQNNTLTELVNAMKTDARIGMVGSHVKDIDNRKITVELGANIRWDVIGTIPVYRNTITEIENIIPVDYVAICSALIDVKALKDVGIMDGRLFLFWDDMEWGLSFKEHGYNVVAAPQSIVYHGSFTERERGATTNYYYGIRNPLLVYTKHTSFFQRTKIFYCYLRSQSKIYFFLKNQSQTFEAGLMYKAFSDYMNNQWGKLSIHNIAQSNAPKTTYETRTAEHNSFKKILISSIGITSEECMTVINCLRNKYPEAEITILSRDDRIEYFKGYKIHILNRQKMSNLSYLIKESIAIKKQKFDAIASVIPTPFIYFGKRSIMFNKKGEIISFTDTNTFSIIKILFLICYSEIMALLVLPFLLYKSLQYVSQPKTGLMSIGNHGYK